MLVAIWWGKSGGTQEYLLNQSKRREASAPGCSPILLLVCFQGLGLRKGFLL